MTLSDPTSAEISDLHADAMVVDTHIHAPHDLGVRVLGLVHYVDNEIGTVCLQWNTWLRVWIPRPRRVLDVIVDGAQPAGQR